MKRGDKFTHARMLDSCNKPIQCVVTRVANGIVYWRHIDGCTGMKFREDQSSNYVKEINND